MVILQQRLLTKKKEGALSGRRLRQRFSLPKKKRTKKGREMKIFIITGF
jgi:hypothetical protein